jgi:hypothetical protein
MARAVRTRGASGGSDSEAASSESEGAEGPHASDEDIAQPLRVRRKRKTFVPFSRHTLEPMVQCTFGCGAMVFPEEGSVCCSAGKHILGPEYNPPIAKDYLSFLQLDHIASDSRFLNDAVAMGSQGVFPTKALGGLGLVHNHYGHLFLMGKPYLVLRNLHGNNAI